MTPYLIMYLLRQSLACVAVVGEDGRFSLIKSWQKRIQWLSSQVYDELGRAGDKLPTNTDDVSE